MTYTLYFVNDDGLCLKEGLVDAAQAQSIDGLVSQFRSALVDIVRQPEFRHVELVEISARDATSSKSFSSEELHEREGEEGEAARPPSRPHPLLHHRAVASPFCAVLTGAGKAQPSPGDGAAAWDDVLGLPSFDVRAVVDFYGLLVGKASSSNALKIQNPETPEEPKSTEDKSIPSATTEASPLRQGAPLVSFSKDTGSLEILDPSLATRVEHIVNRARGARRGFRELYGAWGDVLSDALDSAVMVAAEESDEEEESVATSGSEDDASDDDDDDDDDDGDVDEDKAEEEEPSVYLEPFDLIRLTTLNMVVQFGTLPLPRDQFLKGLGRAAADIAAIARRVTHELPAAAVGGTCAALGRAQRAFWGLEKKLAVAAPPLARHVQSIVRFALAAFLLRRAALILEASRDPFVRASKLQAVPGQEGAVHQLLYGTGPEEAKRVAALRLLEKLNDGLVTEDIYEEKLEVDKEVHARVLKQRLQLLRQYLTQMHDLTGLQKYVDTRALLERQDVHNHLFKRVNPGRGGHAVNRNSLEYLNYHRFGALALVELERDGVVFDPKTRRRLLSQHDVRPVELLKDDPRFKPYLDEETLERLRSKPAVAPPVDSEAGDAPSAVRRRLHPVVWVPNDPLDNFAAAEGAVAKQFRADMAQLDAQMTAARLAAGKRSA